MLASSYLFICTVAAAVISAAVLLLRFRQTAAQDRLATLQSISDAFQSDQKNSPQDTEINWKDGSDALLTMKDRLGRAGYLTPAARRRVRHGAIAVLTGGTLLPLVAVTSISDLSFGLLAACAGFYLSITGLLYYLRYRRHDFEREILYQSPLILEAIILLVESGLGILPALQATVASREQTNPSEPTTIIFKLIYQLSAHGIPFVQALEMVGEATDSRVLRHILLHLGISGSEGGELIPSLRSLSDHAHSEWRLSVEHRVRRLENFVVFPVFASVIGLMLLTAAVPLVPLLNLRDTMDKSSQVISKAGESARVDTPARHNGE